MAASKGVFSVPRQLLQRPQTPSPLYICKRCQSSQNRPEKMNLAIRQAPRLLSELDAKGIPVPIDTPRKKDKWQGLAYPKTRIVLGLLWCGFLYYDMHNNPIDPDHPDAHLDAPSIAGRDARAKRESGVTPSSSMRLRMEAFIKEQQANIVRELEKIDGTRFRTDTWDRSEGGGGISCVMQEGNVFEKAGVNTSVVYGTLPRAGIEKMRANHKALDPDMDSLEFFASGLSLVLHPRNPMAPTVHLNYRYFETTNPDGSPSAWWFGGGTDLTPNYIFDEDAIHFHRTIKEACDCHDKSYYPRFKRWCDNYFRVKHRDESRGVGGIFFDDLDGMEQSDDNEGSSAGAGKDPESLFTFVQDCAKAFLPSYLPILEKRKNMPYSETEKEWQQLRRGRYVEFNLVHDRGTAFGLNTPGARIESILMSLPLTARWQYMHEPKRGSREERLVNILREPADWV